MRPIRPAYFPFDGNVEIFSLVRINIFEIKIFEDIKFMSL
jgi:hypothetical protein